MARYISILVFIGFGWGQDVLLTIDKREFKGKLLEQSDKNTTFLPDGQKKPQKIPNRLIKEIRLESNRIIDFDNDFIIPEIEEKNRSRKNVNSNNQVEFDLEKTKFVKQEMWASIIKVTKGVVLGVNCIIISQLLASLVLKALVFPA